jgi:glucokinase
VPGEGWLDTPRPACAGEDEATYEAHASEGGHSDFTPRDDLEYELLKFLMKRFKQSHRISVERIASGTGIANVYDFLCQHPEYQVHASPPTAMATCT